MIVDSKVFEVNKYLQGILQILFIAINLSKNENLIDFSK